MNYCHWRGCLVKQLLLQERTKGTLQPLAAPTCVVSSHQESLAAAWPRANPNHSQSKHSAGKRCFLTLPCYWSVSLRAETSSVTEIYTVTTSLIFALPSHFSNSPALRNRGERFGQHHITGMCPSRHVHKVAGLPWRSWK